MIFVLDTIKDDMASFRFHKSIERVLGRRFDYECKRLFGQSLAIDIDKYDKLIISGSELSASTTHPEENDVFTIINEFLLADKPILGICYGHQMIARAIGGNECCIKAKTPEFGLTKIDIKENPIFLGIKNPTFMESHFDQVVNLDDSFDIIATNKQTEIQAFQWKGHNVFGVQFHPELNYEEATAMLERNLIEDERCKFYQHRDCLNKEMAEQNEKVILNFCNI